MILLFLLLARVLFQTSRLWLQAGENALSEIELIKSVTNCNARVALVASDVPKLNPSPDNKDNAMAVGPLRNNTMRHKATTLGSRHFKENY